MRSPLGSVAGNDRGDGPSVRQLAARAYHEDGIVLINPGWLASAGDRQALIEMADKVHGPRRRTG